MSTMRDVEGIIILGLALVAVTLFSALRGLYSRSQVQLLAKKSALDPADRAVRVPFAQRAHQPAPAARRAA